MAFAAAVLLAMGVLVFTLFVRGKDIPEPESPSPTAHLEEKKTRIYENLRDLQFEYRLGKLSDEDYQKTKQGLQRELAGILAEIEAVGVVPSVRPKPDGRTCPKCGAKFSKALKFCGECGKAMA